MSITKFLIALSISASAFAQQPQVPVYNFQAWKEQQVLEAQNQILRSSARISQVKAGGGDTKDSAATNLPNSRIKKTSDSSPLQAAEKDLKRAQESLETANGLQFDDYINVYLPTLQDRPEAINRLAEKLSKDELAQVFKSLIQKGSKPYDAKRNQEPVLEGLAASARSKSL